MKCVECKYIVCQECGFCKCNLFWKDIWKEEPPRNEEIFFMTGNESIHHGEIFSDEKLRKCKFHSFNFKKDYECDSLTPIEDRVVYWFPIPKL